MKVRVTGILRRGNKILLVEQNVDSIRSWSLPGGGVEEGEDLDTALIREMREETGLEVKIMRLLYVCDYIKPERHVLHITFELEEVGGIFGLTQPGLDENAIKSISFVPVAELTKKGFEGKFQELVEQNFPGAGSYMGPKSAIGL